MDVADRPAAAAGGSAAAWTILAVLMAKRKAVNGLADAAGRRRHQGPTMIVPGRRRWIATSSSAWPSSSPVHADIDWTRGYEMLDKELQPIVRQSKQGRRYVDKLVKVWLKSGEEKWLLIHVEVQTWKEDDFPKRMHVYNHRIFDRYDREVISLAILADDDPDWRPSQYGYGRWGFRTRTEFPIVKLLDYARTIQALEADPNPFAMVVLAHLKTLETRRSPADRHAWKLRLVKGLYESGDGSGRCAAVVPVHRLDHGAARGAGSGSSGKKSTPTSRRSACHSSTIVRNGSAWRRGCCQGIEVSLKMKFGAEGLKLMPELREIHDHVLLDKILRCDRDGGQPGRPPPGLDSETPVEEGEAGVIRAGTVDGGRGTMRRAPNASRSPCHHLRCPSARHPDRPDATPAGRSGLRGWLRPAAGTGNRRNDTGFRIIRSAIRPSTIRNVAVALSRP